MIQIPFIIRDDDVNYFTETWMLDTVYKEAWSRGFKVSLAVVPYMKATFQEQIPRKFRGKNRIFPITDNTELVVYLKEKLDDGLIDIIQHGCTHALNEFAANDFELLNHKLRKGKTLISEAFNARINTFVAPQEKISRAALKILIENEMNLSKSFTLLELFLTTFPSKMEISRFAALIPRSLNPFKPVSEDAIRISKILVVQWSAFLRESHIGEQIEEARKEFEKRLSKGGVFVLGHHHWEYFDTYSQKLLKNRLAQFNKFLKYAHSQSVWKTTLSDFCTHILAEERNPKHLRV